MVFLKFIDINTTDILNRSQESSVQATNTFTGREMQKVPWCFSA